MNPSSTKLSPTDNRLEGTDLEKVAFAKPATWMRWYTLLPLLIAIKVTWLLLDHLPMLFTGDSESYLATAFINYIPPDRSFLYGFMLRLLALEQNSLLPLLIAQSLCSVIAAALLAHILVSAFSQRRVVAYGAAVMWAAFEPLSLLYERYIMTEAFALLAFVIFVHFSIRYLMRRRVQDVLFAQIAGVTVIAFRTMFVPISLLFSLALPILAWMWVKPKSSCRHSWFAVSIGLVLSVSVTIGGHEVYKYINGNLSHKEPAYQYADGLFLLAAWAPVIRAQDFDDAAAGQTLIDALPVPICALNDRFIREVHRWYPGCLVDLVQRQAGSQLDANQIARKIAINAFKRDPLGVFNLAFANWRDNFNAKLVLDGLHWDRGKFPFQATTVEWLRDKLGVLNAHELHKQVTPTNIWYFQSSTWVMLLALTPFIALLAAVLAQSSSRHNMLFVALLAACIIGATAFGATMVLPRYFHMLAWLIVIPLCVIGDWFWSRIKLQAVHP